MKFISIEINADLIIVSLIGVRRITVKWNEF